MLFARTGRLSRVTVIIALTQLSSLNACEARLRSASLGFAPNNMSTNGVSCDPSTLALVSRSWTRLQTDDVTTTPWGNP